MEVRFDDPKLAKLCCDEREMLRKRGDIAKKLRLRMNALRQAATVRELSMLDPLGNWHPLKSDYSGCWAGDVSRNERIIMRPEGEGDAVDADTVFVLEITDYH